MTDTFLPPDDERHIAGRMRARRPPVPYETFMQEEGIPILRGIGVDDIRNVTLGDWPRLGARGSFLALDGLLGLKGMYVLEVPAAGVLKPEKHLYHEFFIVFEGRGSTEVWKEGSSKKAAFEWQPGTLFTVPLNAWHRLVNATTSPALLLAATNAPPVMDLFPSRQFIFDNPAEYPGFDEDDRDYFKPRQELEPDPVHHRALLKSNVYPDIVNCELPLDNQRAPGYRRIQPEFAGLNHQANGFIAEYPAGRYSTGHCHASGAVLVCLKGEGYTLNWPQSLGPRPWEAGKGELVREQRYKAGGLVAAAPGGGNWFHQHFGLAKDRFRLINYWGGPHPVSPSGEPGDEVVHVNVNLEQGGGNIDYPNEDPYIRKRFKEELERVGGTCTMPDSLYQSSYRIGA
jgi:hypothetical protein